VVSLLGDRFRLGGTIVSEEVPAVFSNGKTWGIDRIVTEVAKEAINERETLKFVGLEGPSTSLEKLYDFKIPGRSLYRWFLLEGRRFNVPTFFKVRTIERELIELGDRHRLDILLVVAAVVQEGKRGIGMENPWAWVGGKPHMFASFRVFVIDLFGRKIIAAHSFLGTKEIDREYWDTNLVTMTDKRLYELTVALRNILEKKIEAVVQHSRFRPVPKKIKELLKGSAKDVP